MCPPAGPHICRPNCAQAGVLEADLRESRPAGGRKTAKVLLEAGIKEPKSAEMVANSRFLHVIRHVSHTLEVGETGAVPSAGSKCGSPWTVRGAGFRLAALAQDDSRL